MVFFTLGPSSSSLNSLVVFNSNSEIRVTNSSYGISGHTFRFPSAWQNICGVITDNTVYWNSQNKFVVYAKDYSQADLAPELFLEDQNLVKPALEKVISDGRLAITFLLVALATRTSFIEAVHDSIPENYTRLIETCLSVVNENCISFLTIKGTFQREVLQADASGITRADVDNRKWKTSNIQLPRGAQIPWPDASDFWVTAAQLNE
jgi:hypothetical protein